jgi:hypothetical protein
LILSFRAYTQPSASVLILFFKRPKSFAGIKNKLHLPIFSYKPTDLFFCELGELYWLNDRITITPKSISEKAWVIIDPHASN